MINSRKSVSDALTQTFQPLIDRYDRLKPSERWAVNGLLVTIILVLFWTVLWAPAKASREMSAAQLAGKQRVLAWVKDNEAKAQAASQGGTATHRSGQSLMSEVTASVQQAGLTLKRYEPEGQDKLRVWFENQSFNAVMRWLDGLQRSQGITVVNIAIDASGAPGMVNAKVVLRD